MKQRQVTSLTLNALNVLGAGGDPTTHSHLAQSPGRQRLPCSAIPLPLPGNAKAQQLMAQLDTGCSEAWHDLHAVIAVA